MKTIVWAPASTLMNENINISRKYMKAIVLLFTKQRSIYIYIYRTATDDCVPCETLSSDSILL